MRSSIRAYCARQLGKTEITVCMVEDVSEPLPGQPWNWDEVRLVREHNYTRQQNFQNYDANYWRDIDSFKDELQSLREETGIIEKEQR